MVSAVERVGRIPEPSPHYIVETTRSFRAEYGEIQAGVVRVTPFSTAQAASCVREPNPSFASALAT